MFSIFTHVMYPARDTNSEPGLPVYKAHPQTSISICKDGKDQTLKK